METAGKTKTVKNNKDLRRVTGLSVPFRQVAMYTAVVLVFQLQEKKTMIFYMD